MGMLRQLHRRLWRDRLFASDGGLGDGAKDEEGEDHGDGDGSNSGTIGEHRADGWGEAVDGEAPDKGAKNSGGPSGEDHEAEESACFVFWDEAKEHRALGDVDAAVDEADACPDDPEHGL